jgi:peptidoglycan/xylan/chitin deacetylase (PgdA/CDA1 family)
MSDLLALCYHAVSDRWPAALSVTPVALERQLARLARRGYVGTTFSALVADPAPRQRTVAITFDDNYRSVLEVAKPILDRHGFPGTLYVPTDWVGEARPMSWPGIDRWVGTEHEPELCSLTWDELRGLDAAGWEIGSHTCSHPHLTEVDDAQLAHELRSSKALIEAELGRPCTSLAYPYGDWDERVHTAAQEAGYAAAGTIPRMLYPARPLVWPRTPIFHVDTQLRFALKVSRTVRRLRARPRVVALAQRLPWL